MASFPLMPRSAVSSQISDIMYALAWPLQTVNTLLIVKPDGKVYNFRAAPTGTFTRSSIT
jgi:hypothetical protein